MAVDYIILYCGKMKDRPRPARSDKRVTCLLLLWECWIYYCYRNCHHFINLTKLFLAKKCELQAS